MPNSPEGIRLKLLRVVENPVQADLIRSILEGSGITVVLPEETISVVYGGALGMKIFVPEEEFDRAKEILAQVKGNGEPENYNGDE